MDCLPVTGATGLIPSVLLSGALLIAGVSLVVMGRRNRQSTLVLLLGIAVLGLSPLINNSGGTALADSGPCPPRPSATVPATPSTTTTTTPSSTTTAAPSTTTSTTTPSTTTTTPSTTTTTTPSTTTTTTPSSTTTTTTPAPLGTISGRLTVDGDLLVINDPPGDYGEAWPGNLDFGPPDPTAPFNLPTISPIIGPYAGATITVTGAGADGTFGTSDDSHATTTTAADGTYSVTGLPDGPYQVSASLPPDAELPVVDVPNGVWMFQTCTAWVAPDGNGGSSPWMFTAPGSPQTVAITSGSSVTGVDFAATNALLSIFQCF